MTDDASVFAGGVHIAPKGHSPESEVRLFELGRENPPVTPDPLDGATEDVERSRARVERGAETGGGATAFVESGRADAGSRGALFESGGEDDRFRRALVDRSGEDAQSGRALEGLGGEDDWFCRALARPVTGDARFCGSHRPDGDHRPPVRRKNDRLLWKEPAGPA
jgi:hypothetical protein